MCLCGKPSTASRSTRSGRLMPPPPAGRCRPDGSAHARRARSRASSPSAAYLARSLRQSHHRAWDVDVVSYVYLYTPMKRRTSLNTLVGAGAGPAHRGRVDAAGGQVVRRSRPVLDPVPVALPHFSRSPGSTATTTAAAGSVMLGVDDEDGTAPAAWPALRRRAAAGEPAPHASRSPGLYFSGRWSWGSRTPWREHSATAARRRASVALFLAPSSTCRRCSP